MLICFNNALLILYNKFKPRDIILLSYTIFIFILKLNYKLKPMEYIYRIFMHMITYIVKGFVTINECN